MSQVRIATFLHLVYNVSVDEAPDYNAMSDSLDVASDRVLEHLLEAEADGLTTDSTVSIGCMAAQLEVEMIVRVGDAAVAADIGRGRVAEAFVATGHRFIPTVTTMDMSPVELVGT